MRVIIVDDEYKVGRMIMRLIKSETVSPDLFDDPREALEAVRSGKFELIITDVSMPLIDGVELMRQVRRFDYDIPIILITGVPSIDTAKKAVELGAFRYLTKPPNPEELRAAVEKAAFAYRMTKIRRKAAELLGGNRDTPGDLTGLSVSLDMALESLWMAYQPIIRGKDGSVFGYEALMRSESDALPRRDDILSAAETLGRLNEVGRRVRNIAPVPFLELKDDSALFINIHPHDLVDEKLLDRTTSLAAMARRVVLEITERASLDQMSSVTETIAWLRAQNYRIAIDDLGSGYAGLTSFAILEPDIVKLDMALIRDIDSSNTKQRLVDSVVKLCKETGVLVVAEGIETVTEFSQCVELGVDLLQGFFIGRPGKPFPEVNF